MASVNGRGLPPLTTAQQSSQPQPLEATRSLLGGQPRGPRQPASPRQTSVHQLPPRPAKP
eukprot:8698915-Pyramimonas_sp.AAC.1